MMPAFQNPTSALRHITLDNITDGETVYQRCILLTGQSPSQSEEDFVSVSTSAFPCQSWPISGNRFKCLIILSPGANVVTLTSYVNGEAGEPTNLNLMYIPLLQTPPLHLTIMIAKDSPLLIDCPPHKQGAISSAHSSLEAAINKFRMTAYMWQALTAEDMRVKGLGRRSFRIEEEWTTETLSQQFIQQAYEASGNHMRSTAKIHLVRTEKTVAELRDAQAAQQNPQARRKDDLHKYFADALKEYGGTFASSAHPIVAGLILDSTYSTEQDLILGHAALGCSNPKGVSLGMIGSHLTYSWPRFMEEIPSCLLDTVVPGDTVGNDNGECGTMWEACSIGQGAFLHEVGHAFGAPHTTGIMARGYAQDWPKNFLSRTAYCAHTKTKGEYVIDGETKNEARWDLSDALSFKVLPHFHLPSDEIQSHEIRVAEPNIQIVYEDGKDEFLRLVLESEAQLARVKFGDKDEPEPSIAKPTSKLQFTLNELEARFDRTKPLTLEVLGMNGKSRVIGNVWKLFSNISFIPVPGSSAVLQKRSIISKKLESLKEDRNKRDMWEWAVLLNEKGVKEVTPAIKIDSRVGCILDGAVIYYKDGHKTPCGPRWNRHGGQHSFGGHASEKIMIPDGVEVVKVQVGNNGRELDGLRFHLSNGTAGGYLYDSSTTHTLEPDTSEKIIGFYGRSDWGSGFDGIQEFGIITAPRGVDLPATIYDLPELQNTDGGHGPRKEHREDEYYSDEDQYDQEDEDEE